MKQLIRFGKYTEHQKQSVIKFIESLEVTGKNEYQVTVKQYQKSKSLEQLGYYFSTVVRVACEWQGLTPEEGHEFLKAHCCFKKVFEIDGEVYEYRPSIKHMKVKPMAEYIDTCVNFLGSKGQYVPPPWYKKEGD